MPTYQFQCETCGDFDLRRPISEASDPALCPTCQHEARRVYTVPSVPRTPAFVAHARERAEKSRHEPDVVTEKTGRPMPHRHGPTRPWQIGH